MQAEFAKLHAGASERWPERTRLATILVTTWSASILRRRTKRDHACTGRPACVRAKLSPPGPGHDEEPAIKPQDPNFAGRVADSFARQSIMQTIGATLHAVAPGEVEIRLPYDQRLAQQDGFLHAGIAATVMDSACGYAAFSLMPAGARVLSIELKTNLLRPARGDYFRALAGVVKAGRRITFTEARLFAHRSGDETLVATMQATMATLVSD